jgi:broad-specificity NMP kinase
MLQESEFRVDAVAYGTELEESLAEIDAEFVDVTNSESWLNDDCTCVFALDTNAKTEDVIANVIEAIGKSRPDEVDWQYVESDGQEVVVFRLWWD